MPPNIGWQRRSIFPLFVLGLFTLLALIITRPLVGQLPTLALGGDALVNLRILQWGRSSLLGGPEALLNLPNGNIFYPYRYTFLFSEHLLPTTALMLPFLTILPGPLAAFNLYTLLTFILTGFSVWLLITYWTGNRWVGLPAGMIVAFAPARLLITDQPNIMTIQWIPLAVLTLNRWLDKGERQDWWLALLFVNLQILSATNYLVHVFILLALLVGFYALVYRDTITRRHVLGILGLALATGMINAPVWWAYFRVSATLGIERDLGAVQLGSAHLLNYLMATPNNLVYGALVPKLAALATSSPGIQPVLALFPGLIALLLTLVALIFLPRPWSRRQQFVIFTLLAWLVVGFFMSLGINDHAFGTRLAPYLRLLLPYRWLYEYMPGFRGFRVPARFAVLVLLATAGLAAYGILALRSKLGRSHSNIYPFLSVALVGLVLVEFITLPLDGERYPYGASLPPIYAWLGSSTSSDSAIIELPYEDWSYVYYVIFHGRRMVNGASSFNPSPLGDEASNLLHRFPSWRSIEWLQRLEVDYVILHPAEYEKVYGPGSWDHVWAEIHAYLESITSVTHAGNDFAFQLAPPICPTQPDGIVVTAAMDQGDEPTGDDTQVHLSFVNPTGAGYAFDPNLPSFLIEEGVQKTCSGGGCRLAFHEPLVLLPGQTSEVTVSLGQLTMVDESQVTAVLSNLGRRVQIGMQSPSEAEDDGPSQLEYSEGFVSDFAGGARLLDYKLSSDELVLCQSLDVDLHWQVPVDGEGQEKATVQLVDRYGWPAVESQIRPWLDAAPDSQVSTRHRLPIPGSLPVGQYTIAVRLQKADDAPLPAHTPEGPMEHLSLGSVVVRPQPPNMDIDNWQPVGASIADTVTLAAYRVDRAQLAPGDWLRLTLGWQADKAPGRDATVFVQIIGPDGKVWGQHDNPPRGGWYPTSLWQPGELVADDYLLRVSPETPPGHYSLVAGMYLPDTLKRLPVQSAEGIPATDAILLTEIEIGSQAVR